MKKKIILNINIDCEYIKLNDELSFFEIIKSNDDWLNEGVQTFKGIVQTTNLKRFLNNPNKDNLRTIYGKYQTQYQAILKTDLNTAIEKQFHEEEFNKILHNPKHIGFNDDTWNVKNIEFVYMDVNKSAYTDNEKNIVIKNIKNDIIYFTNKFYFRLTETDGSEELKKAYLTQLIKLQNKEKIFTQKSFENVMEKYIVNSKEAIRNEFIQNLKTKFDIVQNNHLEVRVENRKEYQLCYDVAYEIYEQVKPVELKLEELISIVLFERLNIYGKLGILGKNYRHLFLSQFLTEIESINLDKCFLKIDLFKNLEKNDKVETKLKL